MNEPVTALTDYALAAVCGVLGSRLGSLSRFWMLAFLALGLAAVLGGTWHGFWQGDALWKATTLSVGVASFGMVVGSARATAGGLTQRLLAGFATLKLATYAAWMMFHDDFIWVVLDTGIALLLVGLMHLRAANGWMLAGVAASVLAGLAQASGIALHAHFNHNDLYHVMQAGAMLLLYRGVKRYATGPCRPST
jgi:hypothetical protein